MGTEDTEIKWLDCDFIICARLIFRKREQHYHLLYLITLWEKQLQSESHRPDNTEEINVEKGAWKSNWKFFCL